MPCRKAISKSSAPATWINPIRGYSMSMMTYTVTAMTAANPTPCGQLDTW